MKDKTAPEKAECGILLATGHILVITDNDYRRLQQRLVTGGNVEGSSGLDSGDIIILQNICMLLQDVSILEK